MVRHSPDWPDRLLRPWHIIIIIIIIGKIMEIAKKNNAQFYEHDDLTPISVEVLYSY